MTSRLVRVGHRGKHPTLQVITTTYEPQPDGTVTECITMETPKDISETQRLRMVQMWETEKVWP
jgi:hypothetical protein